MDHAVRSAITVVCGLIVRLGAANAQSGVSDAASVPEQTMHLVIATTVRHLYQKGAGDAVGLTPGPISLSTSTPGSAT